MITHNVHASIRLPSEIQRPLREGWKHFDKIRKESDLHIERQSHQFMEPMVVPYEILAHLILASDVSCDIGRGEPRSYRGSDRLGRYISH